MNSSNSSNSKETLEEMSSTLGDFFSDASATLRTSSYDLYLHTAFDRTKIINSARSALRLSYYISEILDMSESLN